jgi:hypothetical protein
VGSTSVPSRFRTHACRSRSFIAFILPCRNLGRGGFGAAWLASPSILLASLLPSRACTRMRWCGCFPLTDASPKSSSGTGHTLHFGPTDGWTTCRSMPSPLNYSLTPPYNAPWFTRLFMMGWRPSPPLVSPPWPRANGYSGRPALWHPTAVDSRCLHSSSLRWRGRPDQDLGPIPATDGRRRAVSPFWLV